MHVAYGRFDCLVFGLAVYIRWRVPTIHYGHPCSDECRQYGTGVCRLRAQGHAWSRCRQGVFLPGVGLANTPGNLAKIHMILKGGRPGRREGGAFHKGYCKRVGRVLVRIYWKNSAVYLHFTAQKMP